MRRVRVVRPALDEAPEVLAEGDPLEPCALVARSDAALHQCVIDDDMFEVRKHLDAADELIVVSPVYFAGAPAQLKALLDRMQPYFHSTVRRGEKRPLVLHVVGEGGDPHGFEPLVGGWFARRSPSRASSSSWCSTGSERSTGTARSWPRRMSTPSYPSPRMPHAVRRRRR